VLQKYSGAIQRQFPVNAAFSYNEELVLSSDEVTNDIVCWCTQTGKLLSRMSGNTFSMMRCVTGSNRMIIGHMDSVNRIVTSPTDSCFLSCGRDNRARFYGDVSESLMEGK
jgi:WD40 repeat protein